MFDMRKMLAAGCAALTLSLGLAGCAGSPQRESTGEYLDDSTITTRIKAAFVQDKDVSALDIKVVTFKGTVQLSGFAPNQQMRVKAESIARATPGVKAISNDIQLK